MTMDLHVGKLRLQARWVSVSSICGGLIDVLECRARMSGTIHVRKGAGDRGYGGFLTEWLNNVPFYANKRQSMFSVIRVITGNKR